MTTSLTLATKFSNLWKCIDFDTAWETHETEILYSWEGPQKINSIVMFKDASVIIFNTTRTEYASIPTPKELATLIKHDRGFFPEKLAFLRFLAEHILQSPITEVLKP